MASGPPRDSVGGAKLRALALEVLMLLGRARSWIAPALALVSALSVACSGDARGSVDTFPVGEPIGEVVHALVGPDGGSLRLDDGSLTVTVPPGAVDAPVELGIQEITRTAPHGDARAFRLTPHGQRFAVPVTLSFAGGDASSLVAYQDERGAWIAMTETVLDEDTGTLAAESTHFSDWTFFDAFDLEAEETSVEVGGTVELVVKSCIPEEDEHGLVPLVRTCRPMRETALIHEPSVNGVVNGSAEAGTVARSGATLTYTAPAEVPSSNPVAVSARIEIPGQRAQILVIAEIRVVAGDSYRGTAWFAPDDAYSGEAQVTWTAVEESGGVVTYAPSGTLTVEYPGCTVSPSSGSISPEDGWLMVDWTQSPPTYHGGGTTGWEATITCPEDEEPLHGPVGGGWLNVGEGVANEDGSVLEGENAWWHWSFTR